MDEASSEEEEQANAQFWGIPSIPHIPIPHIPIPIPHIPSIPHIPIPHIPIPGVPIPSIPGLPQIPQIPGIPTTPIPGIPQIPGIPLPGGGSVHLCESNHKFCINNTELLLQYHSSLNTLY